MFRYFLSQTNPFFGGFFYFLFYFFETVFYSIKVDANFRKIPMMLTSFLYIFSESFSFFVLGAKLRPVVVRPPKKRICSRDSMPFCFQKIYQNFFYVCTLTLVETCMQNQISIYLFIFLQ